MIGFYGPIYIHLKISNFTWQLRSEGLININMELVFSLIRLVLILFLDLSIVNNLKVLLNYKLLGQMVH